MAKTITIGAGAKPNPSSVVHSRSPSKGNAAVPCKKCGRG